MENNQVGSCCLFQNGMRYMKGSDFCDTENSRKNGIVQCRINGTEAAKFWMNTSKLGLCT